MARRTIETEVLDFTQALGLLVRRVRAAAASHELSLTESAVMGRLAKDGPATTAELARAEGMKPQSMGATIAALEERGLVERTPHPTDGRQVNIELTAKGSRCGRAWGMRRGRGWRRLSRSSISRNRRRCSLPARLSNGWWRVTSDEQGRRLVTMAALSSDTTKNSRLGSMSHAWRALRHRNFQLFFCWPEHLGDWHLDDAAGDDVAGVSNDPFGAAAWRCQLRGADCFVCAGAVCRCVGGASESPQAAGVDTGCCRSAVARAGRADTGACDHALARSLRSLHCRG